VRDRSIGEVSAPTALVLAIADRAERHHIARCGRGVEDGGREQALDPLLDAVGLLGDVGGERWRLGNA